ncbi:MAG: EF-hand domain-containing protein [Alphaproteobacteria bacterium]|nr:EF-hand domain-containing protein [Alphaproteobacteria bacterium]MBP7759617.1 EF-hand domain-containing protein [Alphaproteobacteria bacterium]MBP7763156.1 EF-hand domain-containing protein [Alphaproteobacteria bacterium]MBP7904615.1 EF-hand domain-containing protein [Alphaproteobacteria bacterium]
MKKLLMLSAAALVLSAGGAFAERGEGGDGPGHHKGERHEKRMEKMFDKKDIDGDGAISQDEHNKASDEWFKEMDADGDGKVTKDEAKAHGEAMRKKWHDRKEKGDDAPPAGTAPPAEAPGEGGAAQ